ncbi:MAG: hypothetical protein JXL97_09595 [Bacteroidales bacterium]|nr:hypothetical protein [Bacteroidales bacterium]
MIKKVTSVLFFVIIACSVYGQNLDESEAYFYLAEHNTHRQIVGVPDVRWSDTLALEAQQQADIVAQNMYSTEIDNYYGVNLYRSTKEPTAKEVVSHWASEQKYFHGDTITEKNLRIFGHYSQIIWKQTVSIGCAMAKTPGGTYIVVCLYNPKGNIIGQKAY